MSASPSTLSPDVILAQAAWKSCFTPSDLNQRLQQWWQTHHPTDQIAVANLSDGGDGWLDTLTALLPDIVRQHHWVTGPLPNSQVNAPYGWNESTHTAYIEASLVHGIRYLLNPDAPDLPEHTGIVQGLDVRHATSYGVGELCQAIFHEHPTTQHLVIAIGGSASVDGGLGCLQALGWQFYDVRQQPIMEPIGAQHLCVIRTIGRSADWQPSSIRLTLLCDVDTPYRDAAGVFGPQKGATSAQVVEYSQALNTLAPHLDTIGETLGQSETPSSPLSEWEGTGAAGGLGLSLRLLSQHTIVMMGTAWLFEQLSMAEWLTTAQWVITGEGRLDATSFMGKATGHLITLVEKEAQRRHREGITTPLTGLFLCGSVDLSVSLPTPWQVMALQSELPTAILDPESSWMALQSRLEATLLAIGSVPSS